MGGRFGFPRVRVKDSVVEAAFGKAVFTKIRIHPGRGGRHTASGTGVHHLHARAIWTLISFDRVADPGDEFVGVICLMRAHMVDVEHGAAIGVTAILHPLGHRCVDPIDLPIQETCFPVF